MSSSSGVELRGFRGAEPLCYLFNIMEERRNGKIFTRDSDHIFRAQATISLLSVDTQFTTKITALKTREIGAIEWVAHFHLAPVLESI